MVAEIMQSEEIEIKLNAKGIKLSQDSDGISIK
jgi:hypothetical protein